MARSWMLVATESIAGFPGLTTPVNDDADTVYLSDNEKVYSWDGSTFTDISGTYFTDGNIPHVIYGLCWFKGYLYACHVNETGSGNDNAKHVSRWNGGTSWTFVREIVNNDGNPPWDTDPATRPVLACDQSVMAVWMPHANPSFPRSAINSTSDGTTWLVDTWESAYNITPNMVYGLESLSRYSQIIAFQDSGDDLAIRNAGNWEEQSPGLGSNDWLLGHDDDWLYYRDGGSPYTIYKTNDWNATQTALSTTHSAIPHDIKCVGSDAIMLRVGLTGTAYTLDSGDFVPDGTVGSGNIYSYFALGTTIYAMSGASGTVRFYSGGTIIPFPGGGGDVGRRHLGLAADAINAYLTGAEDGTLFLEVYDLATLNLARRVEFGAATFAEIDSRNRGLWPVARPGIDGIVYLRGRDGNDVKVQVSDDEGYTFTELDDGEWASDKFCVALLIDPLEPTDVVAVFSDDDIYRSRLSGASWAKVGDGPVTLREAARHHTDGLDLILAGQSAGSGELFFSPNLGASSEDISEATMGVVNGIEVSR